MNLKNLVEMLETAPAQTPLIFRSNAGDIGSGYHVTELKLSRISGIDCAGSVSEWNEAAIQLLDGYSGDHMSVQKIVAILKQSIARVEGLAAAEVHVEFSPKNQGLRIYEINTPEITVSGVVVQLQEAVAACKPAQATGSNCKSLPGNTVAEKNSHGCCEGTNRTHAASLPHQCCT